ncbi:hypothetical protein EV182_002384 [Spiromyces aspiralis]|uniref:Uncharacterized protein n=1 Tax=Spiromyces aspiralis TaxID=68401 RepID=A0ACC1HVA4_9FUNG|nr:hypothetical protein EV182_002384 [Spiromyces aspiralis]
MEDEARKRKERLDMMRKAAGKSAETQMGGTDSKDKPTVRFRNYRPDKAEGTADVIRRDANEVHAQIKDTVEAQMSGVFESVLSEVEKKKSEEDVDIAQIALKKPNMDLKRDLKEKLDKLEPKTQAAIAELIRQRLQASKDKSQEGLADAVIAREEQLKKAADAELED